MNNFLKLHIFELPVFDSQYVAEIKVDQEANFRLDKTKK